MDLITRKDLETLLTEKSPPCVSIFMPTHRGGAEQDPIRWKGHLREAENSLVGLGMRPVEARALLEPAWRLMDDDVFWKHQSDGLAYFLAPEFLRLYRLPVRFEDLLVVTNRFHVTPLLPLLESDGRFYVLALSQNAVRLLQGTRLGISEVEVKGMPRNLEEALATHDRDEPLRYHPRPTSGGTWGAIFSGQGVGIDDHKDELLLYFRRIDRALHAVLREESAPLVLAGVKYLLPIYRQASTYPHVLEQGIEGNPDHLSNQELHDCAWRLLEPYFETARTRAVARFRQLAGTGRTTQNVKEIIPAAVEGRLETLFVALGKPCWGKFDPGTGEVEEHDQREPGDEDLLSLAIAHVLGRGRAVHAVLPSQMPEAAPLAGVFFMPLICRGR